MPKLIKEACTENLEQTLLAEKNGAHRIELCGDLSVGGVTPDKDLIIRSIQQSNLPIKVMVRPRGGNFVYTKSELDLMKEDIIWCKNNKVIEVVFGILKENNQIDVETTEYLAKLAFPMKVTFHKAIDDTPNIFKAIEILKKIPEVTSVLTSGKEATAELGKSNLQKMYEICGSELILIVAGKVTPANLVFLQKEIGAIEFHGKKIVG